MSESAFFEPRARKEATAAIKEIESQTSAEVVVTLRHLSGNYRHADFGFGFGFALLTLIVMWYLPVRFAPIAFFVDVTLGFLFGTFVCSHAPPLRRLLTSRKLRKHNVHQSARAAFVDLGIARCTGRWGILVYVATFERTVEVVADIGVDAKALGAPYSEAIAKMKTALEGSPELDAFLAALRSLGPALATVLPHHDDDVNELPDEVGVDDEAAAEESRA